MSQTITLYSHEIGLNSWKVAIVLEELGLDYERSNIKDVEAEAYRDKNPNGRLSLLSIDDPNTGITPRESGAIIDGFIFECQGKIPTLAKQSVAHPEKVPSAEERYLNEIKRVTRVLNTAPEDKEYLVGDKCSFADLSFIHWYVLMRSIFGDENVDVETEYPN
ncbi:glutathione S- transferase, nitrogen catabolite repression regulator [Mycoblastus sanguinarius]|nr:glutathione S- transferase, nitrogen catabolite repression regulator [Mycoblastus sanguinarius]